jgi:hypothetical protein
VCNGVETPFYLTTETPESPAQKPIIANRPRPEASAVRLHVGDRVVVGLASFTVLADKTAANESSKST